MTPTESVLVAVQTLADYQPNVGAIAHFAGVSYAQAQRSLTELQASGEVIECERMRADGYQVRYVPAGNVPATHHSCSWCHRLNDATVERCASCGHDAQRPRAQCTCYQCKSTISLVLGMP